MPATLWEAEAPKNAASDLTPTNPTAIKYKPLVRG